MQLFTILIFFQKLHYQELIHRKDEIELKRQKIRVSMWFSQIAAKLKLLMQNLEKKSGNWNRMFQIYNKTSFIIVMLSQETQEKCKIQWFHKPLLQDFTT